MENRQTKEKRMHRVWILKMREFFDASNGALYLDIINFSKKKKKGDRTGDGTWRMNSNVIKEERKNSQDEGVFGCERT